MADLNEQLDALHGLMHVRAREIRPDDVLVQARRAPSGQLVGPTVEGVSHLVSLDLAVVLTRGHHGQLEPRCLDASQRVRIVRPSVWRDRWRRHMEALHG